MNTDNIVVVLVRPEESRNVGAVCRAMANSAVHDLRIVGRREELDENRLLSADDEPRDNEVLQAVLSLPARLKTVVYLYYYEGYQTAEIAKLLGRPDSTVRNQLWDARKLLKEDLED